MTDHGSGGSSSGWLDDGTYVQTASVAGRNGPYQLTVSHHEVFDLGGVFSVVDGDVLAAGGSMTRTQFAGHLEKMAKALRAADFDDQKRKASQQ